jgi:hypothetical protein
VHHFLLPLLHRPYYYFVWHHNYLISPNVLVLIRCVGRCAELHVDLSANIGKPFTVTMTSKLHSTARHQAL